MRLPTVKSSSLFTPLEIETIKKVFDLEQREIDPMAESERDFTEYELDVTQNSILKNVTTKSVVLAPYNSSQSNVMVDNKVSDVSVYAGWGKIMKFMNGKMKELDWEYEANNNCNMDNGVFNTEDWSWQPTSQHTTEDERGNVREIMSEWVNESYENPRQNNEIEQVRFELVWRKVVDQLKKKGYPDIEDQLEQGKWNYATAAFYLLANVHNAR